MKFSRPWISLCLAVFASLCGVFAVGCLSDDYRPGLGATNTFPDGAVPVVTADGSVGGGSAGDAALPDAADAAPQMFTIHGTVTGLTGKGLVLQNNGGDNLAIGAAGSFVFAKSIKAGAPYFVSILAQPTDPTQTCTVANAGGTVSADVTSVAITCTTQTYPVGGTVVGVTGTGLVLAITVNGKTESVKVDQNGSFAFPSNVPSGSTFTVAVQTNPTAPSQTCTVNGGSGTVVAGAVTSIVVNCATNKYVIGGSVAGLEGQGLVLANGTSTVTISTNGTFAFAAPVASGAPYAVSVSTQPSNPTQTCSVEAGTGVVGGANVDAVKVTCSTNAFTVGGSVTGLAGAGLVLANNGGDALAIAADGSFTFGAPVASGAAYQVTIQTQPTNPWQTCTVANATGVVAGSAVVNVQIACTANGYTVGGTVTGLTGAGLVLTLNDGTATPIAADGTFTFASPVASGSAYSVAVQSQPTSPSQTCSVASGQGTIAGADIADIAVTCITNKYAIGGTVNGLVGSGLVLKNGTETVSVAPGETAFTFTTLVESGKTYDVSIATQPSNPTQTCSISAGSGTVVAGAVSGIVVNCATNAFVVGGTVSGLAGSGLVLRNGTNSVTVNANGAFAFSTPVASGVAYAVTVGTQPTAPTQVCTVTSGSGVVGAADVTSVRVVCATSTFSVGGVVSSLAGSGLVLQDNGADDLAIPTSGGFTFATRVASGAPYAVTVRTNPTNPWQTCAVTAGAGTVGAANVTSVQVGCTTNRYTIGGTVSGLAGTGLTVSLNGTSVTPVTTNGVFSFAGNLASGTAYTVAIASQPTNPTQTCALTNATGTVAGANVTNVAISCSTNRYSVGGTLAGLAGAGLVLANGSDSVTVPAGATSFTFPTTVASGQTYNVQVSTQPSGPTQTCSVSGGQGSVVVGAPVTSVVVNCATNAYTLGGTVTGLAGTGLVLRNGNTTLAVNANGNFAFGTPISSGTAYAVTVGTQPTGPTQTCTVTNGSGTIVNGNVTSVQVACNTTRFTIGGTVSGLAGTGLVLQNSGADDLAIGANGAFTFSTSVASGAPFAVTVRTSPTNRWQTCTVTNGSGTVGGANVTNVQIACTTNSYSVGGNVTGLAGAGLTLTLNGGSATVLQANGNFTFGTQVLSGNTYAVAVQTQPSGPTQACTVTNGTGTIAGANVAVTVSCATTSFTVGGTISGLAGTGLTLRNNNGPALTIPAGATSFTFPATVPSGSPYLVQIASSPTNPTQTCNLSGAQGTVGGANVTTVVVNCSTNQYTVSGTITGLAGTGLRLSDGATTINASGTTFAFPARNSGLPYNVTVTASPTGPTQACTVTNGAGTLTNQNVSNVAIACATSSSTIALNVTGLTGIQFRVSDAPDTLNIAQSGTFTFPTPLLSGSGYTISFPGQPHRPEQTCAVSSGNGQGVVGGANITVAVKCVTNQYTISVPVSPNGFTCPLVLSDGTNTLNVTPSPNATTTTYSFTPLDSGTAYTMTVSTSNGCTCGSGNNFGTQNVVFATGTLTASDVSLPISCFTQIQ